MWGPLLQISQLRLSSAASLSEIAHLPAQPPTTPPTRRMKKPVPPWEAPLPSPRLTVDPSSFPWPCSSVLSLPPPPGSPPEALTQRSPAGLSVSSVCQQRWEEEDVSSTCHLPPSDWACTPPTGSPNYCSLKGCSLVVPVEEGQVDPPGRRWALGEVQRLQCEVRVLATSPHP